MPVLDCQIWMGNSSSQYGVPIELLPDRPVNLTIKKVILFKFYRKPMSRITLLMSRTALPENVKVSTVSNETIHRLKTPQEICPLVS